MQIAPAVKQTLPYRIARSAYHFRQTQTFKQMRQKWRSASNSQILKEYLIKHRVAKLQIGSGSHPLPGWLNSEYLPDSRQQYHLDATRPFDIPSETFDLVFSEHMIEHIPFPAALNMLRECHRVLRPGGRIRVSTPPLEFVIDLVLRGNTEHRRYIAWHMETWLSEVPHSSGAVVANDFVRNWGHLFIYDAPTLKWALESAGFVEVDKKPLNESDEPLLRGLENANRMPDGLLALSTLTMEARKR